MIPVRNRYVAAGDRDVFVLRSNPARRLLFLGIAALLGVGFVLGFDWSDGFSGESIGGTIFYFVLVVVSLLVASWNQETIFSRPDGTVLFRKRLLLAKIQEDQISLEDITGVLLQTVRLIKGRVDHDRDLQRSGVFSQLVQRRNTFFRLFLETDRGKLLIEDSADVRDLSNLATSISRFLGVQYRTEDV
ncbi:MAG: hypothetical protein ACLFO1_02845 [Spirochaetaceae bacterium]